MRISPVKVICCVLALACPALVAGVGAASATATPARMGASRHAPPLARHFDRDLRQQAVSIDRIHRRSVALAAPGSQNKLAPFTMPVGGGPQNFAVNHVTHTIYIPNGDDGTVSVISPATCNAHDTVGCTKTPPTVAVGNGPGVPVIDAATDTVYVNNFGDNTVSVINGATCNAHVTTGCGQTPPTVTVGENPTDLAFDAATHTLYTANFGDGTVSVINTAHCNAQTHSGCGQTPMTVSFGATQPSGLVLDSATHTLYVANLALTATDPTEPDTVDLLNAATCNASITTGCSGAAASVSVGAASSDGNVAFALDQPTHTLYVANQVDNTVSLVNIARCTASDTAGCSQPTVAAPAVGGATTGLLVDPQSGTLYEVQNGNNTVSVVAIGSCNALHSDGCGSPVGTLRGGVNAQEVGLDPATRSLYVANNIDPGDISIADAASCNATVNIGCDIFPRTVEVGSVPIGIAIDPLTHTAYVANNGDRTISVINTAICNAYRSASCGTAAPTVAVSGIPDLVAVDPATDTVYVTEPKVDAVAIIDGATCNASQTSGCGHTPVTVPVGAGPIAVTIDAALHTAYVTNSGDNTVSVINTATCNASQTSGCAQTPVTAPVGSGPVAVTVDAALHTAYVANENDDTVSVINTATCNASQSQGCASTSPSVAAGDSPDALASDPSTHTLYVSDLFGRAVATINTATCNASTTSGCGQTPGTVAVGSFPSWLAIDPTTHTLYVADFLDDAIAEVNTAACNAMRLTASCELEPQSALVGNGPQAVAIDKLDGTVYVTNGEEAGLDDDVSMLAIS